MPRIQSVSPLFARAGLNTVVALYQKNAPLIYTQFVDTIDNKDNFYRIATKADFSPAGPVLEANGIDYQDFQTPYFMDKTPLKRGIGFSVSTEALESAKYDLFADRGKKMVRSINKSIEADIANFYNLATSTVNATPDGVALFSAAHLLESGTASNIVTGNPALSVTSLAQAVQEMMTQPSHTGDPMMFMGPYDLIVHPANADLANRLVKAQKYPTTNANDPNWAGGMIRNVIVNPYLTLTTMWGLIIGDKEENPLKMVNRRSFTTKEQFDIDKDVMKYTATQIWVRYAGDWRGVIYSAGA